MEKFCNNCKHWKETTADCAARGCITDGRANMSKWEPKDEATEQSTRRRILEQAIQCVCTDRNTQYGSPEDSFKAIAELWNDYLGNTGTAITPHDVGIMLALLKIARIKTGQFKEDSYIDAAGYIACAAQCMKGE